MKLSYKWMSLVAGCFLLTACAEPGFRPSSEARDAVDDLQNLELVGNYAINGFNPCAKAQASKQSGYDVEVKQSSRRGMTIDGEVWTSGRC